MVAYEEAQALAPVMGWLLLACAFFVAILLVVEREGWRRSWLRAEDPRSMGLFRIVFGLCAMGDINSLWSLYGYLFTDEGLFLTDVARHVFAREQFAGFGNGLGDDPHGFFDVQAVWRYLQGPRYSLLFFWDSPAAFWVQWAAFQLAVGALIVGWKTDYAKWISWFLFHSILARNAVFWDESEALLRVLFFYLCLSRCGAAYSLDNWLRCRALRRSGRLSERGFPGNGAGTPPSAEHPLGRQAVYRLIPAWPRMLLILQCGALYGSAGFAKTGDLWWNGDAFYYALNLDHLYRFPPQQVSAWAATHFMRVMTHLVRLWECFFPLVIYGLLVRFGLREHLPRKSNLERKIAAACWVALGLIGLAGCSWLLPAHELARRTGWTAMGIRGAVAVAWVVAMGIIGWLSWRLRNRPFSFYVRKHHLYIDRPTFLAWALGRRVWLFFGVCVHLHLMVALNLGWFPPAALTGFVAFLNGGEIAMALAMIGRWLGRVRVPWIAPAILRGLPPLPAEDPRLPHLNHDGVRLSGTTMLIAILAAVGGVVLHVFGHFRFQDVMLLIAAFLAISMFVEKLRTEPSRRTRIVPRPFSRTTHLEASAPWAYGPTGRFVTNCVVIYHLVGVACWLLPEAGSFAWRGHAQEPFRAWLETTQTTQSWEMLAPNPPRDNRLLRVLVTDGDGTTWDMKTDVHVAESSALPTMGHERRRKIDRRIAGGQGEGSAWYQKWHARWYCRKWALDHEGLAPKTVELIAASYPIPEPAWVRRHGPYDPVELRQKHGRERSLYQAECAAEIDGQLPARLRSRHGLGPSPVQVRRWTVLGRRSEAWRRLQRERTRGEQTR